MCRAGRALDEAVEQPAELLGRGVGHGLLLSGSLGRPGTQPPDSSRPRLTPRCRLDRVEATLPASFGSAAAGSGFFCSALAPASAIEPGTSDAPRRRIGSPEELSIGSSAAGPGSPPLVHAAAGDSGCGSDGCSAGCRDGCSVG